LQVVGTENEDMPQFKLMLNGMLRCPVTIESLSHVVRSGEVLGKLGVFYGRNSFRENAIKAKVKHTTYSSFIQSLEYGNTSPLSTQCRNWFRLPPETFLLRILLYAKINNNT